MERIVIVSTGVANTASVSAAIRRCGFASEITSDPVRVRNAKQVVLPILASTLTTLIVFVPFVYLKGELRVFYIPLAVVVALTLGIFATFVILTDVERANADLEDRLDHTARIVAAM